MLAFSLLITVILIAYVLYLRKTLNELQVVCSTDDNLRRILKVTDELLGKLPNSDVEKFVTSADFELYKTVMKPILAQKTTEKKAPTETPQKTEVPPIQNQAQPEAISLEMQTAKDNQQKTEIPTIQNTQKSISKAKEMPKKKERAQDKKGRGK